MRKLTVIAALLLVGGVGTFLVGALVLTNNARHQDISGAVVVGLGMAAAGVLLFGVLGVTRLLRRASDREADGQ